MIIGIEMKYELRKMSCVTIQFSAARQIDTRSWGIPEKVSFCRRWTNDWKALFGQGSWHLHEWQEVHPCGTCRGCQCSDVSLLPTTGQRCIGKAEPTGNNREAG